MATGQSALWRDSRLPRGHPEACTTLGLNQRLLPAVPGPEKTNQNLHFFFFVIQEHQDQLITDSRPLRFIHGAFSLSVCVHLTTNLNLKNSEFRVVFSLTV